MFVLQPFKEHQNFCVEENKTFESGANIMKLLDFDDMR